MPALEYFMATSSTSSAIFKGSSAYSSDFSNLISRAVAIASLPVQQLTTNKTNLTSQSDELTKLDTTFKALQTAVQKIGTSLGGASFQTQVSNDKVVAVNVADGASEGAYSMRISSIGAYETSMSTDNWSVAADPSGDPTTFTLVVGNRNYSITPDDNSPQSVVKAINASFGSLVQATTVNTQVGVTAISLKSVALGPTNLDLIQVPTNPTTTSLVAQTATSHAISRTSASWDSSGDTPSTYQLVIGGAQYDITPASNSADDVAKAINDDPIYGAQITASVVDLGTDSAHDYRISLKSNSAGSMDGSMTLDLKKDGGPSLQTQQLAWTATADAAGSRSTYNMVIGANKYSFTPADNSAASVAAAINTVYGGDVQASVVDVGTSDSHDYRLSLASKSGSPVMFDIERTAGTHFQEETIPGALASYEVNNSGVTNTSTTRSIAISDGVTATLLGTTTTAADPTGSVDITLSRSSSALGTALSGFADAYNAAVDEVNAQRGQGAGSLAAQPVVSQLRSLLSSISTFSSDGEISGLNKDLGLQLGKDGHIAYDPTVFMFAYFSSSAGVNSYFGSAADGGFLKNATDILNSVEDPLTGLITSYQTDVKTQITNATATIAAKQAAVDTLQIRMQNQMAIADAMIASMEQQASYFTSMFAAQQSADAMYK
jgi:flagellar hook-associated protein 2